MSNTVTRADIVQAIEDYNEFSKQVQSINACKLNRVLYLEGVIKPEINTTAQTEITLYNQIMHINAQPEFKPEFKKEIMDKFFSRFNITPDATTGNKK